MRGCSGQSTVCPARHRACRYCAQELEAEVIGLDDFSQGAGNVPFLSDIRILKGDIANSTFLAGIFAKHSFDVIFHASELAGSAISHHFPSRIYEANLVWPAHSALCRGDRRRSPPPASASLSQPLQLQPARHSPACTPRCTHCR